MLRKNVATQSVWGQMNSRTDGSPLTSAVSINVASAGVYGAGSGTITHRGSGLWEYVFTQAETNYNQIAYQFTHATGVCVGGTVLTTAADPTSATNFGLTNLDGTVASRAAASTALTNATWTDVKAGYIDVSIVSRAPSATALTNATWTDARAGYLDTLNGLVQAIWDKALTGITAVGSVGKLIKDYLDAAVSTRSTYAGGDTAGTTTLLGRIIGTLAAGTHNPQGGDAYARLGAPAGVSVSADVAAIQAKTTNLPASPAAVGSQMDLVNAPNATAVTAIQAGLATAVNLATVDTVVDAIKLSTDNLPSDPADESLVIAATTAIYDRIGAPTGANVSADIAAVKSDTNTVKGKTNSLTFTVGGQVDANVQYVNDVQVAGTGAVGNEWGPV